MTMPFLPLRTLPSTTSANLEQAWLERIADRLASPASDLVADRSLLCRETLAELTFPQYAANTTPRSRMHRSRWALD